MKGTGIYRIVNLLDKKSYIGSAISLKNRWDTHRCQLRKNTHHSPHLQASWNKYGEGMFRFEVLEIVLDKTELTLIENYYISWYDSSNTNFGYNACPRAGSSLGIKRSEEYKKRKSESMRGERNYNFGKKWSREVIEHRRRAINVLRGSAHPKWGKKFPHSLETRAKIKASWKARPSTKGVNNPFYGKKHSAEALRKNREVHIGKKYSAESNYKKGEGNRGKPRSLEVREKIRQGWLRRNAQLAERSKFVMYLNSKGAKQCIGN